MNSGLLEILRCPRCKGRLAQEGNGESGTLRCVLDASHAYPVVRGVPRFVPAQNYTEASFGFQWNRFPKTQLDSHSGKPISRDRFFVSTGWPAEEMRGKWVLDAGCGAGRFAEVSLSTGARVVAIDYSSAVDAAQASLGSHPRLDVVQADIYHLPFAPESFDYVYCLGVLQHTPDVERSFAALVPPLRKGGRLAVDLYPRMWSNLLWPKYWLRPVTKRMRAERLFPLVERMVRLLLPVSRVIGRLPLLGPRLRWFVPVVNYEGVYPLDDRQLYEWSVLDTFDMFAPAHDHPQDARTLRRWMTAARLDPIDVFRAGHLIGRGVKPR